MIFKHPDQWARCHTPSYNERLKRYVHELAKEGYDPISHAQRAKQGLNFIKQLIEKDMNDVRKKQC